MEGPQNAIRFDQTQDTRFFLCLHCRNHVLSFDDCIDREEQLNGIICQDPVNVWADDIILRLFQNNRPVENVCCNECLRTLGHKYVMVTEPNLLIQEGRFMFYLDMMVFWNGTQLVYADTDEPVDN